jgi:hypothetical protein
MESETDILSQWSISSSDPGNWSKSASTQTGSIFGDERTGVTDSQDQIEVQQRQLVAGKTSLLSRTSSDGRRRVAHHHPEI